MSIARMSSRTKKISLLFFAFTIAAGSGSCWSADSGGSADWGAHSWSRLAQQKVESYSEITLPADKIIVTIQEDRDAFVKSKPSIKDGKIHVQAYVPAPAERGSGFDELWCKLKSREAITGSSVAASPQAEPGTCMAMNQAAIDRALRTAPQHTHSHGKADLRITCLPDQQYSRGDQWVQSSVRVEQIDNSTVTVQASSLRTPGWVPWLGGNQYCKLLSPRGAAELVNCITCSCDPAQAGPGVPYVLEEADAGLYTEGSRFSFTAGEDPVDIYLPNAGTGTPLATAVFLQGAKCDKKYYSEFAKLVGSYGFAVAVANHKSLLGKNFTGQTVVNRVWELVKRESRNPASPLYRRINTGLLAIMGHSYGGVAGLNCMQNTCSLPTCIGLSYEAPRELGAVVLYGTNTKSPISGKFGEVATGGIPLLYINGDRDGKALLADTLATFRQKTGGGPKALATVHGANHYGITDMNNPPGGDSDPSAAALPQKQALISIARISGIFMLAHLYNDDSARDYIYQGERRSDPNVSIEAR